MRLGWYDIACRVAAGPVFSEDEKWSFVGALNSPKGRIYVAALERERIRFYAGLEKAGLVRRMEGEGSSARFKDVALEYVYKLTAKGRAVAEGFAGEMKVAAQWDEPGKLVCPPEDWTNPTTPPYSTEDLAGRFVDGAPSYLQAGEGIGMDRFSRLAAGLVSDGLVRRVESVKARFNVVDEWVITELEARLKLSTSERVSQAAVDEWAERNWHQVTAKAGSAVPGPARGRGMEYDEPRGEVHYIRPDGVMWDSRESVDWQQSGDVGVLKVSVSHR